MSDFTCLASKLWRGCQPFFDNFEFPIWFEDAEGLSKGVQILSVLKLDTKIFKVL